MKTALICILLSLSACAPALSAKTTASNAPPPTDQELTFQDKVKQEIHLSKEQLIRQEERAYQDSLDNIEQEMGTDRLKLVSCVQDYGDPSNECYALLKHVCEESMIIDTRSGHHLKEYCSKPYLDYHTPPDILKHHNH